jgi:hypothetical protein
MGLTAYTEPQCLYYGILTLYLTSIQVDVEVPSHQRQYVT